MNLHTEMQILERMFTFKKKVNLDAEANYALFELALTIKHPGKCTLYNVDKYVHFKISRIKIKDE